MNKEQRCRQIERMYVQKWQSRTPNPQARTPRGVNLQALDSEGCSWSPGAPCHSLLLGSSGTVRNSKERKLGVVVVCFLCGSSSVCCRYGQRWYTCKWQLRERGATTSYVIRSESQGRARQRVLTSAPFHAPA